MTVTPPVYDVNPADLDEEATPTGAWTIGEHLDEVTIAKLREIREPHSR